MAKTRWSDKRNQKESVESHAARLERRRILNELRASAPTVEREGRDYRYVLLPDDYLKAVTA